MASKVLLLDLLRQAQRDEDEFAASLSQAERLNPGAENDWSPKDEIAHAAAWIERFVQRVQTPASAVPPAPIDDINSENAEIFEAHRQQSLDEVLAYSRQTRLALLTTVEALSEEDLNDPALLPWLKAEPLCRRAAGNGYTHPMIHYAAYLTRHGRAALATRMEEEGAARLGALDDSPTWRGEILYNLACQFALNGDREKALALLTESLSLQPGLREWSTQDADLVSLREDPAFLALVG